jgi:hypothetical protein
VQQPENEGRRGVPEVRLPDFIIGGAPKCATSSLHYILAEHPDIGIPKGELHFFDADDPITHPDFFFVERGQLASFDPDARHGPLFKAYAERFGPFQEKQNIGEDSTTYLFSDVAASRMKRMLPEVKLIFMLRDPVARAYSQYWHLVSTGRATVSFERALATERSIVLGSTYARQIARYFELFGRDKVEVILFEDFVADAQGATDMATDFVGANRFKIPAAESWRNRTNYPGSVPLQLMVNRVRKPLLAGRYRDHLGARGSGAPKLGNYADKVLRRVASNPLLKGKRQPAMRSSTRAFLTAHFSERNQGLSELIERDLSSVWPGFTG